MEDFFHLTKNDSCTNDLFLCQVFGLTVLFGVFHGLAFLPVVLSLLGPSGSAKDAQKKVSLSKGMKEQGPTKACRDNAAFEDAVTYNL